MKNSNGIGYKYERFFNRIFREGFHGSDRSERKFSADKSLSVQTKKWKQTFNWIVGIHIADAQWL